ncbi:VOC family protein [Derxia gummosa]|uniref:VOC family protein n=1 Tax=Derxia gummosa DSM 723 TaxID=1121388 RepID=A0A8B6X4M1_9BURK|nr:VOC family protein [Derxia gummosa]
MNLLQGIHHAAYRCTDAKRTVDFYRETLGMDLILAISEDRVPSTKAPDPYMHIFLDAGAGNVLAFFELPNSPAMGRDPNTPDWVQHIAFKVKDVDTLVATKARLAAQGIDAIGPTDHGIFKSIYFRDPDGHRLELAADVARPGVLDRLHAVAPEMIEEWSRTRRAVKHAAFLHEEEFAGTEDQA